MTDIALERIDPEVNCFRFYHLSVETDLFGGHCLVIHWGRLGRPGRIRIAASGTAGQMTTRAEGIEKRKIKRGYLPARRS